MEKLGASSKRRAVLLIVFTSVLPGLFEVEPLRASIQISRSAAEQIGKRVWQNECGGTISGLTSWNEGENFASLGIGHFIWYPHGERGPFEESFPKLVSFVAARRVKLPTLLRNGNVPCPWKSRTEFQRAQDSSEMKELRQFLVATIDEQAQFLVTRLQTSLPKMVAQAGEPEKVEHQFARLAGSEQGCYALVDYVNFKGEGTLTTERYRGRGWGLLQVLENMSGSDAGSAPNEFAAAAEKVLRERVSNSPPERHEARWLPGWLARVKSYRVQT